MSDFTWADFQRMENGEEDLLECEGHPDGPIMGGTFYCDGSCRKGIT